MCDQRLRVCLSSYTQFGALRWRVSGLICVPDIVVPPQMLPWLHTFFVSSVFCSPSGLSLLCRLSVFLRFLSVLFLLFFPACVVFCSVSVLCVSSVPPSAPFLLSFFLPSLLFSCVLLLSAEMCVLFGVFGFIWHCLALSCLRLCSICFVCPLFV